MGRSKWPVWRDWPVRFRAFYGEHEVVGPNGKKHLVKAWGIEWLGCRTPRSKQRGSKLFSCKKDVIEHGKYYLPLMDS